VRGRNVFSKEQESRLKAISCKPEVKSLTVSSSWDNMTSPFIASWTCLSDFLITLMRALNRWSSYTSTVFMEFSLIVGYFSEAASMSYFLGNLYNLNLPFEDVFGDLFNQNFIFVSQIENGLGFELVLVTLHAKSFNLSNFNNTRNERISLVNVLCYIGICMESKQLWRLFQWQFLNAI
jgi:hypothetical protein